MDYAIRAANRIMLELSGRSGFEQVLDSIDREVVLDIENTMSTIIREETNLQGTDLRRDKTPG